MEWQFYVINKLMQFKMEHLLNVLSILEKMFFRNLKIIALSYATPRL
jgi:hypothetical protein